MEDRSLAPEDLVLSEEGRIFVLDNEFWKFIASSVLTTKSRQIA